MKTLKKVLIRHQKLNFLFDQDKKRFKLVLWLPNSLPSRHKKGQKIEENPSLRGINVDVLRRFGTKHHNGFR